MKQITTLASIAIFVIGCAKQNETAAAPAPVSLPVLNIAYELATTDTEYPVAIQGKSDVEIRPQVNGTLEKIFVNEGAYVSKGQPLFKINDNIYRQQLNNANAGLHAAEASLLNAKLEVEKLTPLTLNKVVSDFQLKTAKADVAVAKANVAQAMASVEAARINLDYTLIKAPTNGYVSRFPRKQGSLVGTADPIALTNLSDSKEVYAYFSLAENDFISFKNNYPGNTLQEKLQKLPAVALLLSDNTVYSQQGHIDMVDGQFDKTTGAITMRATFPNGAGLLRSGNTGKLRLSIKHDNSIVIPQDATIEIQDKLFVFVVDDKNSVTRQPISISGKSSSNYLIKEGIHTGDRIVLKGFENLPDGAVITPQNTKKLVAKL